MYEFIRGIVEEFRIGLVVSGSVIGPLMDALDVWHGRFIQFKLREFPREDSIDMLRKLFALSGIHVDDSVLEYIAVSMNDYPFHMQLFGYYLVDQRKIDENTIEIARRKVQKILIDYYSRKLLEVKGLDPEAVRILAEVLKPISITELSDNEIDLLLKLERLGYVFRENNEYRIYDRMFGRYMTNVLSNRPEEKYIPEYTSEYFVAKKLAYEENFRDAFISLMSWGPFDIVILRNIGGLRGIGIRVKRTYENKLAISRREIEKIRDIAREMNLIPVIAIVKLPRKDIEYLAIDTNRRSPKLGELLKPLMIDNTGKDEGKDEVIY